MTRKLECPLCGYFKDKEFWEKSSEIRRGNKIYICQNCKAKLLPKELIILRGWSNEKK